MNCFDEYQKKAHETADYPNGCIYSKDNDWVRTNGVNYLYPVFGLAEEAGEVSGKFAKAVRDNDGIIDDERTTEIVKELGDVLWFVSEICTCLGVSLSEVAEKNLSKLASRKQRNVIHGSGDNR